MRAYSIEHLLSWIEEANRANCQRLYAENVDMFKSAWGSSHNHQAWPGGYLDHISDVMNLAVALHHSMSNLRILPFNISDALLVLFLHDLEKPWKTSLHLQTKADKRWFRDTKIAEYDILLTDTQKNAIRYVEGEGNDYANDRRVMNELAAFCHMCDVASARIWHSKEA